jgi:hypothetical protein
MRFINGNSAHKPNNHIDPILEGGMQANDPVYHSPNSEFKAWNNQPQFSPKKKSQTQIYPNQS